MGVCVYVQANVFWVTLLVVLLQIFFVSTVKPIEFARQFFDAFILSFCSLLFFFSRRFLFLWLGLFDAWEPLETRYTISVTHLLTCVSPLGCHSIHLKLIHFRRCVLSTATFPQQPTSKHRFDSSAIARGPRRTCQWWKKKRIRSNKGRAWKMCVCSTYKMYTHACFNRVSVMRTAVTDKQRLYSANRYKNK